ncbi:MAG: tyrosine-type recombinase/integrase [Faecalibacterium sp.]|nr:tyrosine-type recombinase/integrase [Ruminococcus sp.]MCM1393225.1 tyrosine-type recombinase/integrase [Ruminococcus sp.]MCM1485771.1 tyrosine-type recombinase/integrase [Faecalibacterium sp.]
MRSSNGMGTITKRKGVTKPYLVYGTAVNVNGVMKRPYLGSYRTRKEAEQRRMEYYANPNITRTELTFQQVYDDYRKTLKYTELSKSSKSCYSAAYKKSFKLHGIKFSNLRTAQMQEVITDIYNDGKSEATMHKAKNLYLLLYRYAIQNDIVNKNYASYIIIPKVEREKKRALTDIEIQKIKNHAFNGNIAAQWTLYLMYSGWRISEMLDLTRFSYDDENQTFTGGSKTEAGKNRIVPVHPTVQWIVENQLSKNGDTVFCMKNGKKMTADYFRKKMFYPMLEELNIDSSITPHSMRHTFSTLLKRNGADDFYRKRLLGHSSGNVTDDVYTHADINGLKTTIELLKIA